MGTHIVNISLDDAAFKLWDEFPRGTRSRYLREVIKDADTLRQRDLLITALRKQIHSWQITAQETRLTLSGRLKPEKIEEFEERLTLLEEESRMLRELQLLGIYGGEEE